jgi:hypothetical protein
LDQLFDQCHVPISSMEDNLIQGKFNCGVNLAIMWIYRGAITLSEILTSNLGHSLITLNGGIANECSHDIF